MSYIFHPSPPAWHQSTWVLLHLNQEMSKPFHLHNAVSKLIHQNNASHAIYITFHLHKAMSKLIHQYNASHAALNPLPSSYHLHITFISPSSSPSLYFTVLGKFGRDNWAKCWIFGDGQKQPRKKPIFVKIYTHESHFDSISKTPCSFFSNIFLMKRICRQRTSCHPGPLESILQACHVFAQPSPPT